MSVLEIPLSINTPIHDLLVELEGRDFYLTLLFNPRGEFWAMSVKDSAGVLRAAGQKLPKNAPLLRLFDDINLPPGRFWVVDISNKASGDPNRETLGVDHLLLYEESTSA